MILFFSFFFFNDTATTEIYTLSLHDALPISYPTPSGSMASVQMRRPVSSRALASSLSPGRPRPWNAYGEVRGFQAPPRRDRKSTRLNSSHSQISYAVFCLKKKNTTHLPGRAYLSHDHRHAGPHPLHSPRAGTAKGQSVALPPRLHSDASSCLLPPSRAGDH